MIHIHKCLRCNHEWASKNPHPIRCAKCKTPYWNIPKIDRTYEKYPKGRAYGKKAKTIKLRYKSEGRAVIEE